jgi:hypothetical protein
LGLLSHPVRGRTKSAGLHYVTVRRGDWRGLDADDDAKPSKGIARLG